MSYYNRWNPNKVHVEGGVPIIYSKSGKRIRQWDAEQQFKKAIHTMWTWGSRTFRLSTAVTTPTREVYLDRLEWELNNIQSWLGSMREALEEARGTQREQEKIDKLLALAESTPFPAEADAARRKATERQAKQGAA